MELEFEWNEEKARNNLAKHRISFLTAAEIFANKIMDRIDDREDYGEVRWIALGRAATEVFRVVYTWLTDSSHHQRPERRRDERDIYHRQTLP